ncbi:MAG TPA: NeuD/PglB/VioB family sugar acetyltransferase [Planctomycetota bacterium]|jgi:sugar O-acyltransferase (sialic acid O-acetyltransferase NeuD family)|nr:NeuD/PglB/VioB family sugar acetyltransferase [Planctomycetota bacterium]
MESIFVYGAGGQGRVVLDTLKNGLVEYGVSAVVDDNERLHGEKVLGALVQGIEAIGNERGFIAIGDNAARLRIASRYRGRLVTLVHRTAFLSRETRVGEGSVLMAATVVNVGSRIGSNVIINTGATVDHDCTIEDGVHIAPGCHLCGGVKVGAGTLLGVGSVVVPGVRIGRNVFIQAGQTVTRDVPDGALLRVAR